MFISEGIQSAQITLYSDNSGPIKGTTMLASLQELGMMRT